MDQWLKDNVIKDAPPSLYYCPNFITEKEENYLMKQVYAVPKPKWTQLSNRRLQNWGGLPHPKGMIVEEMSDWLQLYARKISELGVFDNNIANHVLVNEYEAGQGIMPHVDGSLYFPTVSTISLGSHTLLDFYQPITDSQCHSETNNRTQQCLVTSFNDRFVCSVLLMPRSLILVRDDMYKTYLHGISERKRDLITDKIVNLGKCDGVQIGDELDRTMRVSLTIRYVPKLVKTKLFLGNRKK